MSVSVEQPLHFGQQLSSPSRSPNHLLHAHTPASPPPQPAADMDTSTSVHTWPPAGQNHDRDDAEMQDTEQPAQRDASTNTVAVQVSAIDDDAMDVTPDAEPHALLPNGPPAQAQADAAITTPLLPIPGDAVSRRTLHCRPAPVFRYAQH